MRVVRDTTGTPHVVRSVDGTSLGVVNPATGAERTLATDSVEQVTDESQLRLAAKGLEPDPDSPLARIADDRAIGVAVALDAAGPAAVQSLLAFESVCESDLHGIVGELQAAGLLRETTVDGRRGYEVTEAATEALARARNSAPDVRDSTPSTRD